MQDVLLAMKDTPLPTILVIAGIFCLLLSVTSQFTGKITVDPTQRFWARLAGAALVVIGIGINYAGSILTDRPNGQNAASSGQLIKVESPAPPSVPPAQPSTNSSPSADSSQAFANAPQPLANPSQQPSANAPQPPANSSQPSANAPQPPANPSQLSANPPPSSADPSEPSNHSSHDGRWVADLPAQGRCPASRLVLDVRGSTISGTVTNPSGTYPVNGRSGDNGEGTIRISNSDENSGTIRFSDHRFVADYRNASCGMRHAEGLKDELADKLTQPSNHSSHDGRWVADLPAQGRCPASHLVLDVRGSTISGTVTNPSGTYPVNGRSGDNGEGTIRISNSDENSGTIRFSDHRFVADYRNASCGMRHAEGLKD